MTPDGATVTFRTFSYAPVPVSSTPPTVRSVHARSNSPLETSVWAPAGMIWSASAAGATQKRASSIHANPATPCLALDRILLEFRMTLPLPSRSRWPPRPDHATWSLPADRRTPVQLGDGLWAFFECRPIVGFSG